MFVTALKSNTWGGNYIVETAGGRHILEVPVDLIRRDEFFTSLRMADPSDISLLQQSTKETEGPVYMITVYIEVAEDGSLDVIVVDGHQRLQAEIANGATSVTVQCFDRWETKQQALNDAVSLNYARYEMSDEDVLSLCRAGRFTQAEIARKTGYSESKVSRLAKIASESLAYLSEAVKMGCITLGSAGKLVDACGGNITKLHALKNRFQTTTREFEAKAKHWANKIKSAPHKKWGSEVKKKAKLATYFKDVKWDDWERALSDDELSGSGASITLHISDGSSKQTRAVSIGDTSDWKKSIAVWGFFGTPIDQLDKSDIAMVADNWDQIGEIIKAIRDGREIPAFNPMEDNEAPDPPEDQDVQMSL